MKSLSPALRDMRITRDLSASRVATAAASSLVSAAVRARGAALSVREGRKKGAFSGALGASFGLLRCWVGVMLVIYFCINGLKRGILG